MELIPSIKLDSRSIASEHADPGATSNVERLVQLSSWMMALGTIRVICAFADSLSAFVDATHHEPISWQMLVRFVEDNHPIVALCAAWPLLLGIALRRSRWPESMVTASCSFSNMPTRSRSSRASKTPDRRVMPRNRRSTPSNDT